MSLLPPPPQGGLLGVVPAADEALFQRALQEEARRVLQDTRMAGNTLLTQGQLPANVGQANPEILSSLSNQSQERNIRQTGLENMQADRAAWAQVPGQYGAAGYQLPGHLAPLTALSNPQIGQQLFQELNKFMGQRDSIQQTGQQTRQNYGYQADLARQQNEEVGAGLAEFLGMFGMNTSPKAAGAAAVNPQVLGHAMTSSAELQSGMEQILADAITPKTDKKGNQLPGTEDIRPEYVPTFRELVNSGVPAASAKQQIMQKQFEEDAARYYAQQQSGGAQLGRALGRTVLQGLMGGADTVGIRGLADYVRGYLTGDPGRQESGRRRIFNQPQEYGR